MLYFPDESVSADIKLETETEDGISEDIPPALPENIYHPRRALKNAIIDWLAEFKRHKQAWGPISKPQPAVTMAIPIPVPIIPSINTCMSLTTTTQATTTVCSPIVISSHTNAEGNHVNGDTGSNQLQALAEACNTVSQPTSDLNFINSSRQFTTFSHIDHRQRQFTTTSRYYTCDSEFVSFREQGNKRTNGMQRHTDRFAVAY